MSSERCFDCDFRHKCLDVFEELGISCRCDAIGTNLINASFRETMTTIGYEVWVRVKERYPVEPMCWFILHIGMTAKLQNFF